MIPPQNLLPNQMIVTPAPSRQLRLGHHRPSINRQSLDGQLKHIESGWESDCYCHRTQPNILTSKFEYCEWIKLNISLNIFFPSRPPLLLTPGNLIWTPQDKGLQCNAASNAWKRKSLRLPDLPLLPLLFHSPLDPWEITLNPNFLRRPVCYSCLENPSLSST